MADLMASTDINDGIRLAELVQQVTEQREPRILRRGLRQLAVILPLADTRSADVGESNGFARAAGAWKDVDVDALKQRVREERDAGTPSPQP